MYLCIDIQFFHCMKRLIVLLLLSVVYFASNAANRQREEICSGDTLPDFSIKSNDGRTITSNELRGKPCMLVFFHTQCWDCKRELPILQEIYHVYADQIDILCISRGEGASSVSAFWEKNGLTLPYSAQEDKTVFKLFARKTIPRIYLCDESGVVRKVFVEKVKQRKLRRSIEKIVNNKKINN